MTPDVRNLYMSMLKWDGEVLRVDGLVEHLEVTVKIKNNRITIVEGK